MAAAVQEAQVKLKREVYLSRAHGILRLAVPTAYLFSVQEFRFRAED